MEQHHQSFGWWQKKKKWINKDELCNLMYIFDELKRFIATINGILRHEYFEIRAVDAIGIICFVQRIRSYFQSGNLIEKTFFSYFLTSANILTNSTHPRTRALTHSWSQAFWNKFHFIFMVLNLNPAAKIHFSDFFPLKCNYRSEDRG